MRKDSDSITKFEIFKSLSELETGIIRRSVYRRSYKAGEPIVREGDAAAGLYLIEKGEVKVYKSLKNRQVELSVLSAGSFFGELTMLSERPRTATVIAVEPTDLLCLFRPEFLEILRHYPAICAKILPGFSRILIDRIDNMHGEISKLKTAEAPGRNA